LINGKNTNKFESKDIKEIHKIMSNTKISGVKANIAKWNKTFAIDLEDLFVLSSFFLKDFSIFKV
jgi:hypothetical protein